MSHLLDCSGLLDSGGRASPLGRPHPVSYPVSYHNLPDSYQYNVVVTRI